MNRLVQSCSHSPKNYDRDIWFGSSHQNRAGSETLPLCLLDLGRNSNPKARHTTTKNKKYKTITGLVGQRYMTKMSQSNKKIRIKEKLPKNNKVLVLIGRLWHSLRFFKKYRQPIRKLWSVSAPVYRRWLNSNKI